jgi:hypothetical protein
MAKLKLSVTIDDEVVEEVDRLADAFGINRSQMMEKMLRASVRDWEQDKRDYEGIVTPMLLKALISSPTFTRGFAKLVGEEMSAEDFERAKQWTEEQTQRGKQRRLAKRKKTADSGPASDEGLVPA